MTFICWMTVTLVHLFFFFPNSRWKIWIWAWKKWSEADKHTPGKATQEPFFHLWLLFPTVSSCDYSNQTAKGPHHLANSGHCNYKAKIFKTVLRNGDLVAPSGFTLLLQVCILKTDRSYNRSSGIYQTLFNKWFCNTKHLCKNIQTKYKAKASLDQYACKPVMGTLALKYTYTFVSSYQ